MTDVVSKNAYQKKKKEKDVVSKKSSKLIMMHSSKKRVFNDNLEDCGESSILLSRSVSLGRTSCPLT